MKINKTILRIFISVFFVFIIIGFKKVSESELSTYLAVSHENQKTNIIADEIANKKYSSVFENVMVFSLNNGYYRSDMNSFVRTASLLKLDFHSLSDLLKNKPANINFSIPLNNNKTIEVELTQSTIFTDGFFKKTKYEPGLYYHGIIKGNQNSVVAISFFKNFVMGIISDESGNYVLGPIKEDKSFRTTNYIIYNDADMLVKSNFHCMTDDFKFDKGMYRSHIIGSKNNVQTTKPIGVCYIADYAMYSYFNSDTTLVVNFISGAFNNVQALYTQESIPTRISSIGIYTSPDPYIDLTSSDTILFLFGSLTQDNFVGNIAQLLSTGHGGSLGGIAWINVLCATYSPSDYSGRFSFCNIDTTYLNFPTYSWTVECMTHEMGHNLASKHTQACVWPVFVNNGIGAIDSCYNAEGNCFSNSEVHGIDHGTIMSYCHLNGHIDFTYGFGPLPGDTIRLGYQLASCIDSALNISEVPVAFSLLQNYPNPFNPSTNIKFALPENGFVTLTVYDITGREVTRLLNNQFYNVGIFTLSLDANKYKLASGVYLYRLNVNNNNKSVYSEIKKMVLIK
jgi:hypothetical protein